MNTKPDADLVVLACTGDKGAFSRLIERHQTMVHQLTHKLVRDTYLAQELAQETMLQAYLSLSDLRDAARFRSWLYGIAINVCKSHFRAQKIDYLSLESLAGGRYVDTGGLIEAPPDPQAAAEARDLHERILAAINTLSPKNRTATLLFYFDQLTVAEIADIVGASPTAIKGRLHKSRQQLKTQLLALDKQSTETQSSLERSKTMIEVKVVDIVKKIQEGTEPPDYYHIITLFDEVGKRLLFIWVGAEQAENIIMHLNAVQVPRPMTYTLMANLLAATGADLESVQVDTLQEATFIATITLRMGGTTQTVDARPSDAINLALRMEKPIYVSETVLRKNGVDITETGKAPTGRGLALIKQHWTQSVGVNHRFTPSASRVLTYASQEAHRLNHAETGTGHLLLGLLRYGLADEILTEMEIFKAPVSSKADIRAHLLAALGQGDHEHPLGQPNQSERLKRVVDLAIEESATLDMGYIGTEHLLLGLLREGAGLGAETLAESTTLELASLRAQVKATLTDKADEQAQEAARQQELVDFVLVEVRE